MRRLLAFILSCFMLMQVMPIFAQAETAGKVYFVSPEGSDDNDGSFESPFKTPTKARDTVRELVVAGGLPVGGVTVYFREGYYEFPDEGFKLTDSDSGTVESPITYCAYNGEKVVFCGGYVIEMADFRRTVDEEILNRIIDDTARPFIYQYDLSTLDNPSLIIDADETSSNDASKEFPNELICDDEVQIAARWPNMKDDGSDNFTYINEGVSWTPTQMVFRMHENFTERMTNWKKKDWPYMHAHGFFVADWLDSRVGIESIRANTITTTSNPRGREVRVGAEVYFYNLLPELDRPGEYWIDPVSKILYYYPTLEANKESKFIVTTLDDYLVTLNASNVTIKGIEFNGSKLRIAKIGSAENSSIDFCKLLNAPNHGIDIGEGRTVESAKNSGIRNSLIKNVSIGISMSAGDSNNLKKSNCFAENNYIYNFSRRRFCYDDGIVSSGCGQRIYNNKIERGNHGALRPAGMLNDVGYNEITDVLRATADAGATYANASWRDLGNEIHNNWYHDLELAESKKDSVFGIRAIYWDEYESGKIMYNNLFTNMEAIGIIMNGGSHSTMNNNVFYKVQREPITVETGPGGDRILFDPSDRIGSQVKQFFNSKTDAWNDYWPWVKDMTYETVIGDFKGNVAKNNVAVESGNYNFYRAEDKTKIDAENNITMTADELFVDAENGDFRIKENSDVYNQIPDFEDIEFEKMGLISDKTLPKVEKSIVLAVDKGGVLNNGKLSLIDSENYLVRPFIEEDKTFVPLRFVAEALGITVEWNEAAQTATLTSSDKTVVFTIGSTSYTVNGETKTLQAAPRVKNFRTLIPLRDCSEAFGKKVAWNGAGLIVIGDSEKVFDDVKEKERIEYLCSMLDI